MRNLRLKTATYYRRGRGISLRVLQTIREGAIQEHRLSEKIGINVDEFRKITGFDSIHLTGKYAILKIFTKSRGNNYSTKKQEKLINENKKKFWGFSEDASVN